MSNGLLKKLALPASVIAGVGGYMSAKSKEMLKKNRLCQLDDNIYLLDFCEEYDIEGVLNNGASSIADLLAAAVRHTDIPADKLTFGDDAGGGCTTFDSFTPNGEHLLSRNFDFKEAPCFVVWTHPKNRYASLSVVDNNFLAYGGKRNKYRPGTALQCYLAPFCCVDGINEKGLSVAVLQIRAKATKQEDPSKKNMVTTAMIRGILDTCANVDEAVALFQKYNMHDSLFTAYHYQLADASGRSVVVEYIDNKLYVYERGNKEYPVAGSVFEDDNLRYHYVCNFTITKEIGNYKVEQHGKDRIEAVKKALAAKEDVLTEMQAMDLLSHVKLNYDHPKYPWRIVALWSAVYNCNQATVKLAANSDYSRIYSFAVNKPFEVLDTQRTEESEYPETEWEF